MIKHYETILSKTFYIQIYEKQAENGLQSRSSENGSAALWIKIIVILNWRYGMVWYGFVGMGGG